MLKNNRKLLNLINYNNIISKRYFFSLFNNEKLKEDLKFPFIRRKELEFMTNEFVDCEYLINNIERYEGQELDIFEKIITSACHAAQEYTYNLRETSISPYEYINGDIVYNIDYKNSIKKIGEMGFSGSEFDPSHGGTQAPFHIASLTRLPFAASNIGLCGVHLTNTLSTIRFIQHYPNIQNKDPLITDMVSGKSHGIVCLAERHSNSSITDVRCRADFYVKDRSYRVRGTKTCIYGGAHQLGTNIFYIVSARVPNSPDGSDGLTLFLIPKYLRPKLTLEEAYAQGKFLTSSLEPNDITIKQVYKIGDSACTYVDIEFGVETQLGALAYLIGKENEGMKGIRYFLHYNNLQIGWNAISCSLSAYYHSLAYSHDPQALETLKNIPSAFYEEIKQEVPEFPDDGHIYMTYTATVPSVELSKQMEYLFHEDPNLITDGRQIKRPLLARPDIKLLLVAQKAYSEGGLALCVYLSYLQDIIENDRRRNPHDVELSSLAEILSPVAKCFCTKYSLKSIEYAKQIFDGVGVANGNITTELQKACEIFYQDGFNYDLHSFDLLNHRINANNGLGYIKLQQLIQETLNEAKQECNEEFVSYVNIIHEILQSHIKVTNSLITTFKSNTKQTSSASSVSFLANSREYMELTSCLVIGWMWLKQGIISYKKLSSPIKSKLPAWEQNYYVGKIATLDYYCQVELVKAKSSVEILENNPQIHNQFSPEWF